MSKTNTYSTPNGASTPQPTYDPNPPTIAAFSPSSTAGYQASQKQRSTIIVNKKSPLLVATPPQITRALAHNHPFLLPLNWFFGLITWTTEDPWESYLLVAAFWAVTLYGDQIVRFATPILVVTAMILGMYSRRYSPLSSTSKTGDKRSHKRAPSESSSSHHKSLDEIVESLNEFTNRCNILLQPFLTLTDFLSTQRTPTSATTRPALTTLFIRILLVTPFWIALTLPPLHILTTRRVVLAVGTIILTWHSRPLRVCRVILWRSIFIRRLSSIITGLSFDINPDSQSSSKPSSTLSANKKAHSSSPGVRFTFILYENQRRWIGLGWTTSLFAYERGPWTDEHLNPAPSREEFELPDVDGGISKWRWAPNSDWRIERGDAKQHARNVSQSGKTNKDGDGGDGGGWIYYDNHWEEGRKEDGWGRYTRRRKWYRDAELVEVSPAITPVATRDEKQSGTDTETEEEKIRRAREFAKGISTPTTATTATPSIPIPHTPKADGKDTLEPGSAQSASVRKRGWFGRNRSDSKSSSSKNTGLTQTSTRSKDSVEEDHVDRWRDGDGRHRGFSVQEDVVMGLG